MAIDHRIPLQAQSFDMLGMLGRGSELAQFYTKQKTDNEMTRIYNESQGDLDKMLSIAPQSKMARWIMPQLQSQKAAEAQALREQQKHDVDVAKIQSETLGNNDKVAQSRLSAMHKAIGHAAMTGDKNAAIYAAKAAQSAGAITPEQYTESIGILNSMGSVEEIKQYATSVQQMLSQDPAKFNSTTADNRLDNETSRANNEATVGATLAGQQVQKEIANDKLEFDKSQTSALFTTQQQDIKDGKAKLEVINGVTYLDYGNGRGEIYVDKNGQPMKPVSSTKPESRTEIIERKEKAQNFAAASRSAADGATLAASILKRYQALNYNPVQFAAASRIPGSEAYNIVRDTETLKSNIFLARAGDMRGLGALTESEGAKLENSFGSLDPSQGNQFITNLGNIAQQFSNIAKNNANKTGLYMGRDGNVVQATQKPAATAETKPPSPKGLTMSLSEVKQAAQGAGISTEQAVQQLRSQGVIIK